MTNFYEEGNHVQMEKDGIFTCTCMWGTIQLGRYPKNPELRKDCKHVKAIKEKLKNGIKSD